MAAWREVTREDGNIKDIERGLKNSFRWVWLEEKDHNEQFLSDYIRKISLPGKAICKYCNSLLSYVSGGKKDLKTHSKNKKHIAQVKIIKTNTTLPANHSLAKSTKDCEIPYGAAPNIHESLHCNSKRKPPKPMVSVTDRKAHSEAMIVSFLAEHSLPFTIAPSLIALTQELSKDSRVLQELNMGKTSASYKLREGLGAHLFENLLAELRESKFSFNIDECMSNAKEKIFSIIVSYYSEANKQVVLKHYRSESFTIVNAKTLFQYTMNALNEDKIPLTNLISNLSDSTNYMCGKISGFESLLRKEVPHLLDIDGDVCHHVHNSSRKFLSPFNHYKEQLLTDLRTDMEWSTDLQEYLKEICELLMISYQMPAARIDHRWLSAYDAAVVDESMLPAMTLLYYAWLSKEDKVVYKENLQALKKEMSDNARKRLKEIRIACFKKSLTESGKARKKRIVSKLFHTRLTTDLQINFYISTLPLFKSFVLIFEQKEPMVHRLHDELKETLKSFLACFLKLEKVKNISAKKLTEIDIKDINNQKPMSQWFTGNKSTQIVSTLRHDHPIREKFYASVRTAYENGAKYIQEKFPLKNNVLKLLSSIDPACQGNTVAAQMMKRLPKYFPTVIMQNMVDEFNLEVDYYHLQNDLPIATLKRLDEWWTEVFLLIQCPCLAQLIKSVLSIFTGRMIEQSFSSMNDIVNKKTNQLKIDTYSAIQHVKYDLKSSKQTSISKYKRLNFLRSPVDKQLCEKITTSWKSYESKINANRQKRKTYTEEMGVSRAKKRKKVCTHEKAVSIKSTVLRK